MKIKTYPIISLIIILTLNACSPFTIVSTTGEQATPVESYDLAGTGYQSVSVDNVEVEVGVGSPILVEIVASGTWPDLCSQIAALDSQINGFQIDITVLASTIESCPPDQLGLPFRFAIPLNIVEMEAGTYTINVNGASTTFDLPISR